MDACDRAYHSFGWQPKLKKRVRHLVEGGTAWGVEIHGAEYAWVGDKLGRRWQVSCGSLAAALQPTTSREIVEMSAGSWNCSKLYRRPALALLDSIYRCKRNWIPGAARGVSWRLREELILCSISASFYRVNIRNSLASQLYCTDATLSRGQITSADIPAHINESLHYWSDLRGRRTWLKPQGIAVRDKSGFVKERILSEVDGAFSGLREALQHRNVLGYRFKRSDHINILENGVVTTLIKWWSRDKKYWNKRHFIGVDNSTTKGTRNRGRSSSFRLNRPQRISFPFVVGGDMNYTTYFVPSEANATDDGTRNESIRKAHLPSSHIRRALDNEGPLFPEDALQHRFVRGLPRGPAAVPLMQAVDNPESLTDFLTKHNQRSPVNFLKPPVLSSGRARLRSVGRRSSPTFRVGVLHAKRTIKANVMLRSRSADILRFEPRQLNKLLNLVHSKQVHGV